jgi:hypothetical protein
MKNFVDSLGRNWVVSVNVATIKQVRALVDVDLLKCVEGDLLRELAADPVRMVDVVYAICKNEADARQITDEDFGRAMAGDAIEHAWDALIDEVANFFPTARRQMLRRVAGKLRDLDKATMTALEKRIDNLDINKLIESTLEQRGDSSGNSPA